jgi:type 2 lantibiotic biosynthesis protein LanM
MHLVQKRMPIGAEKNRPRLADRAVNVLDYRQSILDGFSAMYSLLSAHRDDLLSEAGPLARFKGDEVCVFLRSSRTYRRLLRESYHPDVLRDGLDRDRLFDLLWVEVEDDPDLVTVIRAEREDLLRGDVPVFITHAGSRDLWTSAVDSIPDFFPQASLSIVGGLLTGLGPEDFARQVWFIQASLATLGSDAVGPSVPSLTVPVAATRDRLLAAARAVGDRLETTALRGRSGITWIGLNVEHDCWSIAPLGLDLSEGLPGAALFLAYLGAVTAQDKYTRLAEGALSTLQGQIEEERESLRSIGGFEGWGGVIYLLTHLGRLWRRRDLIRDANSATDLLPDLILQDEVLNVFGGAAGCIGALLCLHEYAPSSRLRTLVTECGDHLLACLEAIEPGGFAYGASGAAWALFQLYSCTGLGRFRDAALSLTARAPSADESPLVDTSWCRGASGVGLARLRSLFEADNPGLRAEIGTALKTTVRQGFGRNHSLCHGDLGQLEFVWEASRVFGAPQCRSDFQGLAAAVLTSIESGGWRCGTPFGVESPGLMTGLAGIGYGLLRLAEPGRVPSVLLQESPYDGRLGAA